MIFGVGRRPNLVEQGTRILLVDDDAVIADLLAEVVSRAGYRPSTANSADEALEKLGVEPYQVVLSDIVMPGRSGLDLLRTIRASRPDLAVILMSGAAELQIVVEALRTGAFDYVAKPVNNVELLMALERAMERRRLWLELEGYRKNLEQKVKEQTSALADALTAKEQAWEAALQALVDALDAREQETERHSLRVMRFTEMLARVYGVDEELLPDISRGALLHDIGKIGIPDAILLKPAGLTEAEWTVMKAHAEIGWQILRGIEYLAPAAEMVHAHQERWDGAGYPRGLKGEQIPLGARLFAIVDAFDAIVSDRPYRKGRPVEWAREEIRRCGGTQFDPKGVEAFLRIPAEEWTRAKHQFEQEETARRGRNEPTPVPMPFAKLRPV
jgi:putative nucleotidyltransferase with HDIG domain